MPDEEPPVEPADGCDDEDCDDEALKAYIDECIRQLLLGFLAD